jgi:hypothetical protein
MNIDKHENKILVVIVCCLAACLAYITLNKPRLPFDVNTKDRTVQATIVAKVVYYIDEATDPSTVLTEPLAIESVNGFFTTVEVIHHSIDKVETIKR